MPNPTLTDNVILHNLEPSVTVLTMQLQIRGIQTHVLDCEGNETIREIKVYLFKIFVVIIIILLNFLATNCPIRKCRGL